MAQSLDDWPLLVKRTDMSGWVRRLKWGPNDKYLYGAGQDAETIVWDAQGSGYPIVKHWDSEPYFVTGAYPSPNNDVFVRTIAQTTATVRSIGNDDGTGWDDIATLDPGVTDEFGNASWHPDGDEIALADKAGYIYIYTDGNWVSPDRTYDFTSEVSDGDIIDIDWSEDGQYLACAFNYSDDILIVNPNDGSIVTRFTSDGGILTATQFGPYTNKLFYTKEDSVTIVSVGDSNGNNWTEDHTYTIDEATYALYGDFRLLDTYIIVPVLSVSNNVSGVYLLSSDAPYEELLTIPTDNQQTDTAEFSENGERLAIGNRDGTLYIRGPPKGSLLEVIVDASIPSGTSATLTLYADTTGNGTADEQGSRQLGDGVERYGFEIDSDNVHDHWIDIEFSVDSPTSETPSVTDVTANTRVFAGSVLSYGRDSIKTQNSSLRTQ